MKLQANNYSWVVACLALFAAIDSSQAEVDFNQQIRPILSQHCIACHGPDEADRQADFRVDDAASAKGDRGGYAVVVAGSSDESELIRRITSDDEDERMPPTDHAEPLGATEIALLRQWIAEGARYERHWSFVRPTRPDVPTIAGSSQHGEIDRFVRARLYEARLEPNPLASAHRQLRRASLATTGLPPIAHRERSSKAKSTFDAFLNNPSEGNYEQVVDELLASPAYGEHWATRWLDLARYADSVGYAGDEERTIWPWRDWVITAFNDNMPFDQFTIEQLAGDLLPNPTETQRLATAFHRNTLCNNEGGTNDEEFRTIAVKDRISTTMNVWMGLTMRCAECHSHKYDPISHHEYYAFLDFFNQTADADLNDERPRMDLYLNGREIAVRVPVMEELPADRRRTTHVMQRGNFRSLGDEVQAATPAAFPPMQKELPPNRLGVARWLVGPDNPLTARVTVNRFWAQLFGRGLVETEENFGTQGSYPSHPQLLDWLAVDFQEHGWDMQRLLKQMVMSTTFRQQSRSSIASVAKDPQNILLSRGPRYRLSAEVVRDQTLAAAGLLSSQLYGRPVFPPSPIKKIVNAFTGGMTWQESKGEDRYRRAIYTFLKRSQPHPLFATFDMAGRDICRLRRFRTNTPLQSFMTLNDPAFIEAAAALAQIMIEAGGDSDSVQIETSVACGLERALSRPARDAEIEPLIALYEQTAQRYADNIEQAMELTGREQPEGAAERAALTVVANVILNLDEFLCN